MGIWTQEIFPNMVLDKDMDIGAGLVALRSWLKSQQHLPQTMRKLGNELIDSE